MVCTERIGVSSIYMQYSKWMSGLFSFVEGSRKYFFPFPREKSKTKSLKKKTERLKCERLLYNIGQINKEKIRN